MKDSLTQNKNSPPFLKKLPTFSLQDIIIAVIPLLLVVVIFLIETEIKKIENSLNTITLLTDPVKDFTAASYPKVRTDETLNLALPFASQISNGTTSIVSATSAVVIDDNSQVILFAKNAQSVFPMASTTKIMTALVALDIYSPNDILTIQSENITGVTVGFKKGEQYYFKDLLYAMLLPSGNDAALAIAQNHPGGEEQYVFLMNRKAQDLFLKNTIFQDVTGLSERNRSTAYDLAKLSSFAIKNKTFADIVQTKKRVISDVSGIKTHSLTNLNRLLGVEGVNGIKTGYTEEAGEVLVTSRVIDSRTILAVVMKSNNRFADTQSLLSFINKNLRYVTVDSLLND